MNDRMLGLAALAFAALLAYFGYGLEAPFAYEPVGPRAFPLLTATLIAACGVVLTIKGGGRPERLPPGTLQGLGLLSLVLLSYALLFQWLGFVLATLAMVVLVARIFGGSWLGSVLVGLALSVGGFLLFDRVLDVVLPAGLLGRLAGGLV